MVMVVGNRVVGDSRVEKAAATAHNAGYVVTLLGLHHRSVPTMGVTEKIPIFRVSPDYSMHQNWLVGHGQEKLDVYARAVEGRRRLRQLRSRSHALKRSSLRRRISSSIHRRVEDAALKVGAVRQKSRLGIARVRASLPIPGSWRAAWPIMADLELAFASAIVDLRPDIIHVHDRHILPGATTAASIIAASGNRVKVVYDAHEWLPGVEFQGPKVESIAWMAAEAELIAKVDTVITVSSELADMLRDRHNLSRRPFVVTNSPLSQSRPAKPGDRTSVREDCGLDSQTDLLVYVGSIAKVRGTETLLQALPLLPTVHLALVAPPHAKRRIEIADLDSELGVGNRVHVLDYVPSSLVASYISSASIGVSPVEAIENYQYSLATKIREYLHARLPIVASNLRRLTEFLEETGVGAVHRPGDPWDCARTIEEVLRNRPEYVRAISDELVAEHSWERQETILIDAWAELLDYRRPIAYQPRSGPRLTIGPSVELERSRSLMAAVIDEVQGTGFVLRRDSVVGRSDPLRAKIDEFRKLVATSDGLILESLQPLFGSLISDKETQLKQLIGLRPIAFMLDAVAGVDPEEFIERVPDCWLMTLGIEARQRIARQGRQTRRLLSEMNVPVLATSPFPMRELVNAIWIPTVVDVVVRASPSEKPLRVVVAPGPRAGMDVSVPKEISKLSSPNLEVLTPSLNGDFQNTLRTADILVDNFGHGSYTDVGARALGLGCVVVSRNVSVVRSELPETCPVVEATPNTVTDIVSDLAGDRESLVRLQMAGAAYAREVHGGTTSARIAIDAFGWSS